jgi:hypothetical protein
MQLTGCGYVLNASDVEEIAAQLIGKKYLRLEGGGGGGGGGQPPRPASGKLPLAGLAFK